MLLKRRWIAGAVLALIGLTALTGCDVFQIHPSSPGYESGIIVETGETGNSAGAGGAGVGVHSSTGPGPDNTGSSTQKLGSGAGGPITPPGPGREGR